MKSVVIPEGIEKIENHWFCCSKVEQIEIPASVREIGADVFYGCKSLKNVTFAEDSKLEKIGSGCFCKSGIERITIPKGFEEIQNDAFRDCENLKEVVFEAGSALRKIGDRAFCNCKSLKNIQFPGDLETIGMGWFARSGLEEVVLPESVKSIESYTFSLCN